MMTLEWFILKATSESTNRCEQLKLTRRVHGVAQALCLWVGLNRQTAVTAIIEPQVFLFPYAVTDQKQTLFHFRAKSETSALRL